MKQKKKKSHRNYKKKNCRYKIENIYQKAKIKKLEQSLEFQKYNVKEKKKKKKKKVKKIIKYIYMKFAEEEKKQGLFFLQSNRL